MKIVVASPNPVKLNAAKEAFLAMFPEENFEFKGVSVPSGVSDQPMTDEETYTGALNRAAGAVEIVPDADYWVGIEGGLERKNGEIEAFAWVVVKGKDRTGKGRSSTFFLPQAVVRKIDEGMELGAASDAVFNETNSKQNTGTIGILTNGLIDRTKYYIEPAIIALIPFAHPELYPVS